MTIFLSTTFCRRSLPQRVLVCHFRRRRMCCLGYYLALLPNGKYICDNNLHYHLCLGVTFVFEIIILAIVVVLKKIFHSVTIVSRCIICWELGVGIMQAE